MGSRSAKSTWSDRPACPGCPSRHAGCARRQCRGFFHAIFGDGSGVSRALRSVLCVCWPPVPGVDICGIFCTRRRLVGVEISWLSWLTTTAGFSASPTPLWRMRARSVPSGIEPGGRACSRHPIPGATAVATSKPSTGTRWSCCRKAESAGRSSSHAPKVISPSSSRHGSTICSPQTSPSRTGPRRGALCQAGQRRVPPARHAAGRAADGLRPDRLQRGALLHRRWRGSRAFRCPPRRRRPARWTSAARPRERRGGRSGGHRLRLADRLCRKAYRRRLRRSAGTRVRPRAANPGLPDPALSAA